MKKKALMIFVLLFWMLVACTLLSVKVEEQMIPQVTTVTASRGYSFDSDPEVPLSCLFFDSNGMHLYSTYEGTGWEAGIRVKEESPSSYEVGEESVILTNGWSGTFIEFASKPLKPGELVSEKRGGEQIEDHWLAVFSQEKPEFSELPEGVSLEEENDGAVLLSIAKAQQPYMDGRAKSLVPEFFNAQVYSFAEMRKFLDALPQVGLAAAMILAAVTIWACCCFMVKDVKKHWVGLLTGAVFGLLLLVGLHFVLGSVDLPSSLLPREKITDIGYFYQEYTEFFNALKSFAPPASESGFLEPNLPKTPAAKEMISYKNALIMRPFLLMTLAIVLPLVLRFVEWAILYKRSLPKIK